MIWPFKRKKKQPEPEPEALALPEPTPEPEYDPYIRAEADGVALEYRDGALRCEGGESYECRSPMVYFGVPFKAGDVVGKKHKHKR